jgi:cholesterol 7-dehydrogenase
MIEIITLLSSIILENPKLHISVVLIILYIFYYYKYGFYIFRQKHSFTQGKHRIGKTLPAHPNGWFIVARSGEIKVGETKYIDAHGESLVLFRANNGSSYVLSAYCPHLGANLGVEGRVVHDSCIQCPFHAWTFDGETGECVIGKDKKPKEGIQYEYEFDCETNKCEFKPKQTEKIKIKKFLSQEHSGYVYVWFSAKQGEDINQLNQENTQGKGKMKNKETFTPPYEPLNVSAIQKNLCYRGYSLNIVNCHISDIAENGGDLLHFIYIHNEIIPLLVKGHWEAKWIRGDDPQLLEKMAVVGKPSHQAHRTHLLDSFLNEHNKKYIGVISLKNEISVLNIVKNMHFFTLTGFQVGPGLVYLFLKSDFFETMFIQHIDTKEKYKQEVYHEIYTNWLVPYWFSALQLRLEARQVLLDGVIWDNKKFGYQAYFNKNQNESDTYLITWRQWFVQFYEGCKEEEEKKKALGW